MVSESDEPGLGDWVAGNLAAIGLTEEAYCEFKGRVGLIPECNCDARRRWLNEFGHRFGSKAKKALRGMLK
jgi:hypothetical protein